jgi:predicted anti-sigma-YlaC factor YlaD
MIDPSPEPNPPCVSVTDAISARLDGESHPLSSTVVARHLATCATCTRFEVDAATIAGRTRDLATAPTPDLAPSILAAVTEDQLATDHRRTLELRWLVALAGLVQLAFALPVLAGAASADLHVGRDLGALQLALGVGLVLAAWQPQRSAGVLPIATVVAITVLAAAGWDVASGVTTLGAELTHLGEVFGVLAVWALRRRVPSGPPSIRAALSAT